MNARRGLLRATTALSIGLFSIPLVYFGVYNLEKLLPPRPYMYNVAYESSSFLGRGRLSRKADLFQADIDQNHITPEGLLRSNGKPISENRCEGETSVGDSMLETSLYLMSQVLRHSVSGDSSAKANIDSLVGGLHGLFEVTGKEGFPARFYAERGVELNHGSTRQGEGENSDFVWVGDTSRDQYIGLVSAYSLCYDLIDDPILKRIMRRDLSALGHHLLDNGLQLVGPNGEPTRYGSMSRFFEANTLSVFKTAADITGEERFEEEYEKRSGFYSRFGLPTVPDFRINLMFHNRNYNDVMSVLCLSNLIRRESDPGLIADYQRDMRRMWENSLRGEGNAFFNFAYLASGSADFDSLAMREGLKTLDLFPVEKEDFELVSEDTLERRVALNLCGVKLESVVANPLPIHQRRFGTPFVWQNCPYDVGKPGVDNTKYPRVDFLLAYWMGRHQGYIGEMD